VSLVCYFLLMVSVMFLGINFTKLNYVNSSVLCCLNVIFRKEVLLKCIYPCLSQVGDVKLHYYCVQYTQYCTQYVYHVSFGTWLVLGMLVDIQMKLWCTIVRILYN
jgi:hypothetical protein